MPNCATGLKFIRKKKGELKQHTTSKNCSKFNPIDSQVWHFPMSIAFSSWRNSTQSHCLSEKKKCGQHKNGAGYIHTHSKQKQKRNKLPKEPQKMGKSSSGSLSSASQRTYSLCAGPLKPWPWTALGMQNQVGKQTEKPKINNCWSYMNC